jgi:hypothetical protein
MNLLAIIKTVVSLLPFIRMAIHAAEQVIGPGRGADKLARVVDAVGVMLPADDVAHAAEVKELLPVAISAAVAIMNQKGELPKGAPTEQQAGG